MTYNNLALFYKQLNNINNCALLFLELEKQELRFNS